MRAWEKMSRTRGQNDRLCTIRESAQITDPLIRKTLSHTNGQQAHEKKLFLNQTNFAVLLGFSEVGISKCFT